MTDSERLAVEWLAKHDLHPNESPRNYDISVDSIASLVALLEQVRAMEQVACVRICEECAWGGPSLIVERIRARATQEEARCD